MRGVSLLGTLNRALERRKRERDPSSHPATTTKGFKVVVLHRGDPEYERLLALGNQLTNNVQTAIDEIQQELHRMAGRVVTSDYETNKAQMINYAEFYTLDPQYLFQKLRKSQGEVNEKEEEEDEEDDEEDEEDEDEEEDEGESSCY